MRIAVGIVDQRSLAWSPSVGEEAFQLSMWWTQQLAPGDLSASAGYFTPRAEKDFIFVGNSVDEILQKTSLAGFDFCIVQFSGFFPWRSAFYEHLRNTCKQHGAGTFLICDTESENIKESFFVVNLKIWSESDRPAYHRSQWLQLAQSKNLPLRGIEIPLRLTSWHLWPKDEEQYYLHQPEFQKVINKAKYSIFFANDEGYPRCQTELKQIDRFYGLAASFKGNLILEMNGYHEGTVHVQYDYNSDELAFKKALVDEWDGDDYIGFCQWYTRHDFLNFPDFGGTEKYWLDLQEEFKKLPCGSFKEHWHHYKKINHKYICSDIAGVGRKLLFNAIDRNPNSAIWWSHVFSSMPTVYHLGFKGAKISYTSWMRDLQKLNPDLYVLSSWTDTMDSLPVARIKDLENAR